MGLSVGLGIVVGFCMFVAFGGPHIDIHIPGAEEIAKEIEIKEPQIPIDDGEGGIKWVDGV